MPAPEQISSSLNDPHTRAILEFVHDIGIQIVLQPIHIDTVLPGITIDNGPSSSTKHCPSSQVISSTSQAISPLSRPTIAARSATPTASQPRR